MATYRQADSFNSGKYTTISTTRWGEITGYWMTDWLSNAFLPKIPDLLFCYDICILQKIKAIILESKLRLTGGLRQLQLISVTTFFKQLSRTGADVNYYDFSTKVFIRS